MVIVIYYHSMQALVQRYIISDIMGCKDTTTDHNQVASWPSSFFFIFYKNFRVVKYAPKFSMTSCFIIFGIVSITDSFGNRANNFSTNLQKGCIFRFWIYLSNEWGKYKACLPDFNTNVHDQISLTLVKINP